MPFFPQDRTGVDGNTDIKLSLRLADTPNGQNAPAIARLTIFAGTIYW
ncbi:hypothetical protein NGC23_19725 [Leclercia pneumoniae]|nr:hypothetical protein [Leclercia pneumoniae]MEB7502403.1 hypothetical protein [Leclercia pneumoniae]